MSTEVVPSVEVAPGVTVNASMTAEERFNIIAKSIGAPEVTRPAGPVFGPSGHPPLPGEGSGIVVDAEAVAKLNAAWSAMSADQRDSKRELFERDWKLLFEGRKATESVGEFYQRKAPPGLSTEALTSFVQTEMRRNGWIS